MDGEFKLKSYTKLVEKVKHCLTNFLLNFSAVNFPFPPTALQLNGLSLGTDVSTGDS